MHTIDEQRIAELEEQVSGLRQAVGGGRIAVPKPTGAGQLAQLLAHQLETHGRPVFIDALSALGLLLAPPVAAQKLKVLAPGDQVEFTPDGAWEGPKQGPGGSLVYTVKAGASLARVKVKHANDTEQAHPGAVDSYNGGDQVVVSGTVMHFPR